MLLPRNPAVDDVEVAAADRCRRDAHESICRLPERGLWHVDQLDLAEIFEDKGTHD